MKPELRLFLPIARATTPEWLTATLAVAAILLAILAVGLMFRRVAISERNPPIADDDGSGPAASPARHYPAVYYDPVLVVSAIVVIGLAVAVWLLR